MKRQRRPSMKKAATVGSLIENLLSRSGMDAKLREYRAWQVWDEVVGPQIAARARPSRIREGVLEVRVDQPVWMQQLQLLKPKILTRLNERLDGAEIKDIFLRRGKPAEPATAEQAFQPRPPDPPLTAAEKERIESVLEPLGDPELKEHLRHLLTRQLRLEKGRGSTGRD